MLKQFVFIIVFAFALQPGVWASFKSRLPLTQAVIKRMIEDRDIVTHAKLDGGRYEYYAAMVVRSSPQKARRILTDYPLYAKMISYIHKASYKPALGPNVVELQGGIWNFKMASFVQFEEQKDKIVYRVIDGSFKGLSGEISFEAVEPGKTIAFFNGFLIANAWPPKIIVERGAEIVFGFTAKRMRSYIESEADVGGNNGEGPKPRRRF